VTKDFVEFLDLYGSFAGEDLGESEDESAIESEDEESRPADDPSETRPLLGRRKSSRRARKPGNASTTKSFFTLLKAFVGTGIMFLPKAFNNGGILFSSITLVTVSLVSCICFHLLLQCRKRYGGGYGDLGEAIGGPKLRSLILESITISQIGFVCTGVVFTAENLLSFVLAVSGGSTPLSTNALIAIQLVVLIPLALIRNISKLGPAALLADVCILVGLIYIWHYDISTIADRGVHKTVELFNPQHFTLTVGSAIFTFEGIGLLLPIQSSMKEPDKFSRLLYIVMFLIIIFFFTSVSALCYLTFGSQTQTEVISNFPQTSKLVNAVQFLYSLAVLVGTPVQLFPAVRIMEGKLFGHLSGNRDSSTKWKKNIFRARIVLLSGVIAALGADDLDKFVALIGSLACVPLVYIYPAFLYYKGIAESRLVVAADILLMVLGLSAMVYTTFINISQWVAE
jgi:solute carrier family 36 (proton-coupled amino acid transporter)